MIRKSKVSEHTIVDENGELKSKKVVNVYQSHSEDFFIKLYLKQIQYLKNFTTAEIVIFLVFLKYIDYKNKLNITLDIKKKVTNDTGYSIRTVNNTLSKLKKKKLLIHESMGSYLVNPEFVGKGGWKDISELRSKLEHHEWFFE